MRNRCLQCPSVVEPSFQTPAYPLVSDLVGTLCSPYLTFVGTMVCENELVQNFNVRPANIDDLQKVCQVEYASFTHNPYPAFLIERLLRDQKALFFVATDQSNEIIGYLVSRVEDQYAHLISIAVLPSKRRSGAATQLLKTLISTLRKTRIHEVGLQVRPNNKAAIQLYARFEFSQECTIPRYYSDGSSALIMRKVIE
jgi:ribosomal-protein-alanine N-acetyltransferase